jgi:hypothetical protein
VYATFVLIVPICLLFLCSDNSFIDVLQFSEKPMRTLVQSELLDGTFGLLPLFEHRERINRLHVHSLFLPGQRINMKLSETFLLLSSLLVHFALSLDQ